MAGIKVYVDTSKVRVRFSRMAPDALDKLSSAAKDLESELLAKAQDLASGEILQVRSGKYVSAIKGSVRTNKSGVYGQVGSRDPRADLFEYGGKTGPHDIDARNAKALRFSIGGVNELYASVVHHPGGDYGRESFGAGSRGKYSVIFTAFDAMRASIFAQLYGAVENAVEAE